MAITDDELIRLNKMGLIPGPDESEEEFRSRSVYCLQLDENMLPCYPDIPFQRDEQATKNEQLKDSFALTEPLYGIAPSWVPVFYSNKGLAPWHGACAWIFQSTEEAPTAAVLQMRVVWKKQETWMKFYSRKELLAHELCHVGRMKFQERKFEEVLAYRASSSKLQRWLGPIIETSHEAMMFMSFLFLAVIADLFVLLSGYHHYAPLLGWLKVIPLLFIVYGLIRLTRKHNLFNKALKNISGMAKNEQALIYRLTDKEIEAFAKMNPAQIRQYAEESMKKDLRWRAIFLSSH